MANLQILSHASELLFSASPIVLSSERRFGALTVNSLFKLITTKIVATFGRYCNTPVIHRFQVFLLCLSSDQHFRTLTVKSVYNPITTQSIASMQNALTRLQINVFSSSYFAYNKRDISGL